jgi:hypothetical protein
MNVIDGRSAALAGVVAVAALSGTLVGEPAHAGVYAFGNSEPSSDYATLIDSVSPSADGFQGPVGNDSFNSAARNGRAPRGASHGNFTVTSAKLTLYSGAISGELNYSLYGATQAITQLSDGVSADTALYNELGQGVKYGSFVIDGGNSLHALMFTLNAAAVSGVDAAILGKKTAIAISGTAVAVPEPSTWIVMLAGFAGLGLAPAGGRREAGPHQWPDKPPRRVA